MLVKHKGGSLLLREKSLSGGKIYPTFPLLGGTCAAGIKLPRPKVVCPLVFSRALKIKSECLSAKLTATAVGGYNYVVYK